MCGFHDSWAHVLVLERLMSIVLLIEHMTALR